MQGLNNVTVQTPEEFLKCFSLNTFTSDATKVENEIQSFQRIGEPSAIGEVYLTNRNTVIKKGIYCREPRNPNEVILNKLCDMAKKGSYVYHIPNSPSKKKIVLAPNYFIEPIVNKLVYDDCVMLDHTPSFMKIVDFIWDSNKNAFYSEYEQLKSPKDFITSSSDYLYYLFQVFWALNIAQQTGKFVHYDLHSGNLMVREYSTPVLSSYPLPDGKWLYTYKKYDVVIIDYGHSRYETKNFIVAPNLLFTTDSSREYLDYYEFNPYYDIFSILNIMMRNISSIFPNWANAGTNGLTTTSKLMDLFLNGKIINSVEIPNIWRPYPEKLATTNNRTLTPSEMIIHIANMIGTVAPQQLRNSWMSRGLAISDVKLTATGMRCFKDIPVKDREDIPFNTYKYLDLVIPNEFVDNVVSIKSIFGILPIRTTIAPFNHTLTQNIINNNGYENGYVHIAEITPKNNSDYRFKLECCRTSVHKYFQHSEIKAGIAINASFFNIGGDYSPIGYFKSTSGNGDNSNYVSENPIPTGYEGFYGIVGIDAYGNLQIDKYSNRYLYTSALTCGPMLVWDGQRLITDSTIANDKRLQCSLGGEGDVLKCSDIKPGMLSHASNPNPRTAVAIGKNGKVYFITVEGRDSQGDGMDLSQLSDFCSRDPDIIRAINLDGGRSSQMFWKRQQETVIYGANPTHENEYLVGNILSFVKQK